MEKIIFKVRKNVFWIGLSSLFLLTYCNNKEFSSEKKQNLDSLKKPIKSKLVLKDETSWYKVNFLQLCNDSLGDYLDTKLLKKYGIDKPYNITENKDKKMGTSAISFDFNSDCCLKFTGSVTLKNGKLILRYYWPNDTASPCDCYCNYRMMYRINSKDKQWSTFKIIQGRD